MHNTEEKWVVLGGFFGRFNCGDEAMLQCIYETFIEKYNVAIIVDGYGSQDKFWDLYPYNKAKIINRANIDFYSNHNVKLFHVGGGGLSIGYLADHVYYAKIHGVKCALTGIEFFEHSLQSQNAINKYIELFDFVSFRNRSDKYLNCTSDWAFNLITDSSSEVPNIPNRAALVFREYFNKPNHFDLFSSFYNTLLHTTIRSGHFPVIVPFCPEDLKWIKHFELHRDYPVYESYSNPRRMQQFFNESDLVLTAGRYHPLILALNADVKTAAISMESITCEIDQKIRNACDQLSIEYIENVDINSIKNIHKPKGFDELYKNQKSLLFNTINQLVRLAN